MGQTVHFVWELPEALLDAVGQDADAIVEAVKQAAVLDWVRMHKLSWRKAADLLGMTYRDFLALMAEHHIPTLEYPEGWLDSELSALARVQETPRA